MEMLRDNTYTVIRSASTCNTGRKAAIHTADRDIEGIILPVKTDMVKQPSPDPYYMSPRGIKSLWLYWSSISIVRSCDDEDGKRNCSAQPFFNSEGRVSGWWPGELMRSKQKCPSITMNLEKPAGGQKWRSLILRGSDLDTGISSICRSEDCEVQCHALVINEVTILKMWRSSLWPVS